MTKKTAQGQWPKRASDREFFYMDHGDFHVGQVYEDEAAKTIVCKTCMGSSFKVGCGSYLTVLKCMTCNYEQVIHDG